MLRKIAVIGGNGFVGRHVIKEASRRGIATVGVVRSDAAVTAVRALGAIPVQLATLELPETTRLTASLEGCDGVVHTASVSTGVKGTDRTDPGGLVNVLDACRSANVPRAVLFSGLGLAHYGMNPHCTNPYFLAKMAGEVAAFRSGLAVTVFRPSYIFGPGDEFLSPLIRRILASPVVEIPGDGGYRLQPISVEDAARAVLGAMESSHDAARVVDLVGPDVISYRELVQRIGTLMRAELLITGRSIEDALAIARESTYFGLRPHDLACLLCDEVSDSEAVRALVGADLERLDLVLRRTIAEVGAEVANA